MTILGYSIPVLDYQTTDTMASSKTSHHVDFKHRSNLDRVSTSVISPVSHPNPKRLRSNGFKRREN